MKNDAADDLHAVRLESDDSPRSLPDGRECFRKDIIQTLAILISLLEFRGLIAKLLIGKLRITVFEAHDFLYYRLDLLQLTLGMCAEYLFHESHLNLRLLSSKTHVLSDLVHAALKSAVWLM